MSQIPSMMSGVSTALSQAYAKPSTTNCMSFRAINKPDRTHYFIIKAFCSCPATNSGDGATLFRRWTAADRGCLCPSTAGSLNWRQGHLCPLLHSKRAAATIPPLSNSRLGHQRPVAKPPTDCGRHHLFRATSPTQSRVSCCLEIAAGAMHLRRLEADALMHWFWMDALMHLRPTSTVSLQSSLEHS